MVQILSLHNCTKLRSTALSAIAGGCPQLRMLMLGGCSLSLTPSTSTSSGVGRVMLLFTPSSLLCPSTAVVCWYVQELRRMQQDHAFVHHCLDHYVMFVTACRLARR